GNKSRSVRKLTSASFPLGQTAHGLFTRRMPMRPDFRLFLTTAAALTLFSSASYAADADIGVVKYTAGGGSPRNAEPMENSLPHPDTSGVMADVGAGRLSKGVMTDKGAVKMDSRAFGSFGIPYTVTRVQAGNQSAAGTTSANQLSTTYPFRTIGKFT